VNENTCTELLTLGADLPRAHQVALVAHEDDGSLRLRLPEEQPQLGGPVEAPPVGHREHQHADLAAQRRQVLSTGERGLQNAGKYREY